MADAPLLANSGDRDDPGNYVSFDDYLAGSSKVYSLQTLSARWNAAHPEDPVDAYGDFITPPVGPNYDALSGDDSSFTKVVAGVQLVGGGLEFVIALGALMAPEPTGATKVVGVILITHSLDTIQASVRTIISGERTATYTQQGAAGAASFAGASPQTAQTIGVVTDVGVGLAGSFGVGALSKAGPGAAQLVHLTSADSAAAIRSSQAFGLGKSTLYAGPEALSKAKGFSILARTGVMPSKATDVILLPSKANSAFVIVKPIGPITAWQRVNGTVFSAGAGTLNLETGVFTRTGVAANQLVIFGIDSAMGASVKGTAELINTP